MVISIGVHGSVGGSKLENPDFSPRRFAPGRTCSEPGCETVLSIYNETDYCALHQLEVVSRSDFVRGKRSNQRSVA